MFRLSDLTNKDKSPQPPTPPPPPVPPASRQIVETPPAPPAAPPAGPSQKTGELERAYGHLYEALVSCVKALFEQARADKPLDLAEAWRLVKQLPTVKTDECQALLGLLERHSRDNYLYTHAVNVAILASHLGHCLGHSEESVYDVALAGLLLDIGMAGDPEHLASLQRKLTAEEWKAIATHPAKALEHLKTARDLPQDVLDAISTHHQRPDDHGHHPGGGGGGDMADFGKILAVCDVYDALTHPRSYRNRFSHAQAIKVLVDGANTRFDRRVIKALVDALSLYPRGSVVRLSTNEIAKVEMVRPEAPLRPVVLISRDANQVPLSSPRRLDLLEQPFVYVKEVVTDEDL
ncbi:MAG: hypothetical protein HY596_00790 [Candidatus Omnitrophica bacterium]|nr:hypothetical protein [Candidatus Omnitrophota bacterium]